MPRAQPRRRGEARRMSATEAHVVRRSGRHRRIMAGPESSTPFALDAPIWGRFGYRCRLRDDGFVIDGSCRGAVLNGERHEYDRALKRADPDSGAGGTENDLSRLSQSALCLEFFVALGSDLRTYSNHGRRAGSQGAEHRQFSSGPCTRGRQARDHARRRRLGENRVAARPRRYW